MGMPEQKPQVGMNITPDGIIYEILEDGTIKRIGKVSSNGEFEPFRMPKNWNCPQCGRENESEDNFCGECGTKKPGANFPDPALSQPEVKNPAKFSGLLLSAAILFVVLTIINISFDFYRYSFFNSWDFFFIFLPHLMYLSVSTLIFAKKEKWLFILFGVLSVIILIQTVAVFYHITVYELFFLLFKVTTYVIITWESFKVFKNRQPSSVLSIVAVVIAILSIIPLSLGYVRIFLSFGYILYPVPLILYLIWISKRK